MKDDTKIITKEKYEELKKGLEQAGFVVVSKYRKGMQSIKLGDIQLSPSVKDLKK